MKKRHARRLIYAVEKIIGRKKFKVDFMIEAAKHHNLKSTLIHCNKQILKHQVAIAAFNKGWDYKDVLCLWMQQPQPDPSSLFPGLPPVVTSDDVICFLLYGTTFDEFVVQVIQMCNLKAFL